MTATMEKRSRTARESGEAEYQKKNYSHGAGSLPERPSTRTSSQTELLDETAALLDEIDAVLEVELPKSEKITLSDLMRRGSKLHPQMIGNWYGEKGETCALSAALDGAKELGLV